MAETHRAYAKHFTNNQQVKIAIKLADKKILDAAGIVRFIEGDRLTLELVGSETPEEKSIETGSDAFVIFSTGWSMCRCSAVLMQKMYGRRLLVRLSGPVNEKQTREYFRLDVSIPLSYTVPEKQLLPAVHQQWDATRELLQELSEPVLAPYQGGFRVVRWNGQSDIPPCPVNLSGGGLRFKTREYIEQNSLVTVNLFLPLVPPRVIHVVTEAIRCNEILLGRESGSTYMTAMRFHFISDKDREAIIAYIFAEQRRILNAHAGKLF